MSESLKCDAVEEDGNALAIHVVVRDGPRGIGERGQEREGPLARLNVQAVADADEGADREAPIGAHVSIEEDRRARRDLLQDFGREAGAVRGLCAG